jgi:hypothetical protein
MKLLRLAALAAFTLPVYAQTLQSGNIWLVYNGDHPIASSKWGAHLEGHLRRSDLGLKWQQLLVRPAVNYQLTKTIALSGGYTFLQTHPWGAIPNRAPLHEHRIHEQISYSRKIFKLDFTHRVRLEQRYIGVLGKQVDGSYAIDSFRYQNRIRYQGRTQIPLKFGDRKNYLTLSDEVFFNFGKNVDRNVFDQNRATISLGRDLGHQTRFEVGFMEQTLQRRGGQVFENNHTLQFTLNSRIPIF